MTAYQQAGLDLAKLKLLAEFFPIGKELRYSPDAQLVVVFDTIIVAYCVNDHYIYSRNAIRTDSNGNPSAVLLGEEGTELPADKIYQLSLLVPDTSDKEGTLDYDRRAIIGRQQQFLKGHVITLMTSTGAKGVASLTTKVAEQVTLGEGPYSNSKMVLLSPDLDDLSVTDQHHKSRGKTSVPIDLHVKKGEAPYPCVLSDFSESSVGLSTSENQHSMPLMEINDAVTIVINLGEVAKTFVIKGRIVRRSADSCVIHLEELFKGHEFLQFNLLDSLALKTGLLNYGN
ncbi:MAG: PilZ domain-containing protein [Proteobacteria bacterium]|nr:PilZ domain-containing protein [Pseudomonadota bacterium]